MEDRIKKLKQENKNLRTILGMIDEYFSGTAISDPEILKDYVKKALKQGQPKT